MVAQITWGPAMRTSTSSAKMKPRAFSRCFFDVGEIPVAVAPRPAKPSTLETSRYFFFFCLPAAFFPGCGADLDFICGLVVGAGLPDFAGGFADGFCVPVGAGAFADGACW